MTDTSLNGLLRWMAAPTSDVLAGWDAIVAMDRSKTNQLLGQTYVAGYASGSYLPSMSGEVELVDGRFKQRFDEVMLGVPRLSFEPTGLDNSKARLTLTLVSGLEVMLQKNGDLWQVQKISQMQPLQGPQLYLDLQLDKVPGNVGEQGRVALDLRDSDNFHLTVSESLEDQQRGGEFFRELFIALPDEQRIFVLGSIEAGALPALQPHSFRLSTQCKTAGGAEGAILILLSMSEDRTGQALPTSYPWVIPTDAGCDYSASLLFKRRRVLEGSVMQMLSGLVGEAQFTYQHDGQGNLSEVTATAGVLTVAPIDLEFPVGTDANGNALMVTARVGELTLPANVPQALHVSFTDDQADIVWRSVGGADCTLILGDASAPVWMRCSLALHAGYEFEAQGAALRRTVWDLQVLVDWPNKPDSARDGADATDLGKIIFYWLAIIGAIGVFYPTKAVGTHLAQRMIESLAPDEAINAFIHEAIRLNFAHAIEADTLRLPRDLGAFGRVSPLLGSLVVDPALPLVVAGGHLQLHTEPVRSELHWSVHRLNDPSQDPGNITVNGLYSAPPATTFTTPFVDVRVTAVDAAGHVGAALVKVMRSAISLDPLIQECQGGAAVTIKVALLGEGLLHWSVRSLTDGPCGTLTAGFAECTYTAPSNADAGNRCQVDEVSVRFESGAAVLSHVVIPAAQSPVTIRPVSGMSAASTGVQLQAYVGDTLLENVQWQLPLGGPGSLDAEGFYSAPTSGNECFVLVVARATRMNRVVEGHLIMTLPLARFFA